MKTKITLLLILVAAAAFFMFTRRHESKPPMEPISVEDYGSFQGAPPLLKVAFEYPKNWKIFISQASRAEEATVQVMGPRDMSRQFSASFAVVGKKKMKDDSLETEVEKVIERNKALDQFKVISKGPAQVAGQDAQRIVFDFVINLPVGVLNAPPVTMREEIIFFAKAELLYRVYFVGTLKQHEQNGAHFESLLRSLRFIE